MNDDGGMKTFLNLLLFAVGVMTLFLLVNQLRHSYYYKVELVVVDFSYSYEDDELTKVEAEIENRGSVLAKDVSIIFKFFDEKNNYVGDCQSYADTDNIPPLKKSKLRSHCRLPEWKTCKIDNVQWKENDYYWHKKMPIIKVNNNPEKEE
jgi:hypothetical protein